MQCKEACWCLLGTGYKVSAREGWRQYGCHKQIELVGSPNIFSEEGGGGVQAWDRHLTIFLGI